MTVRPLYKAEFDFRPSHKLWLRTNHTPQFDGGDTGMRRRTRLVPFEQIVKIKDPKLPVKLRAEADGILQWALKGLAHYRVHGLVEPAAITQATEEYLDSLDTIGQFLLECCDLGAHQVKQQELFNAYAGWVRNRGQFPVSINRFMSEMDARGFKRVTVRGERLRRGLKLAGLAGDIPW
jgi:putative DNA primase/helicase